MLKIRSVILGPELVERAKNLLKIVKILCCAQDNKFAFQSVISVIVMCTMLPIANAQTNQINKTVDNIYTEDKTNIAIDANRQTFSIKLKSNPTTGYSWFLREYDAKLVSPIKHHFQKPTEKLIGAPGFEIWTFRMKSAAFIVPQQTIIRLIYARPWQGAESSTQLVYRISTMAK
ncbi:MAG: hypothetical protein ACD_46C00685G0007 [uncultured bacterium]|nr:MAG: hypothetical protein ACD_46C00685G0007 [uncultured bacterium]